MKDVDLPHPNTADDHVQEADHLEEGDEVELPQGATDGTGQDRRPNDDIINRTTNISRLLFVVINLLYSLLIGNITI